MDSLPWAILFLYFMVIFIFYLSFIFFLKKINMKKMSGKSKIFKTQFWIKWC